MKPTTTPKIEQRDLAKLIPNPRNSRKHPPEQIELLRSSIREFGITRPILVDEADMVIAGHGLREAAMAEGIKRGPVIVARGWSDAQKRAYVIMDNKAALGSTWDEDVLREEMLGLRALGFDLALTGFSLTDLEPLFLDGKPTADPEAAPEPPKNPVSRLGDLWICGDHRVLCGDSTHAESVARLLGQAKPNLMVTDPPYGVNYDPNWRNSAGRAPDGGFQRLKSGKAWKPIGARAIGQVKNDDKADWREAWALFPGDVVYCWHAGLHAPAVADSFSAVGFVVRSQIIWNKGRMIIGRGDYHWKHEPCWYLVREGKAGHWGGGRSQTTIWDITHQASETGHGTQKPIDCMRLPIQNNSKRGDAVYDPFLGSGTTMIAAEMEKRKCLGSELDPAYVDVIVERWQTFSGKKATLDGGGTFEQTKADRIDSKIAKKRLRSIKSGKEKLVKGKKLDARLKELT